MDLELIGTGRLAEVYAWDDGLALKLYHSVDLNWIAEKEAEATRAVVAAGVPAAQCHDTVMIDGRVGLILDRLPGPVMVDIILDEPQRAITGLAELHARIHDRTATGFHSIRDSLAERITRAVPDDLQPAVFERLTELPDGRSVLHGDLHVMNAMLGNDGTWVAIDWNTAFTGPHHYGVARSLFLITEADLGDIEPVPGITEARRRLGEAYLTEYAAHRDLDRREVAAWRLPVLAARLAEPIPAERDYLLTEIGAEIRQSGAGHSALPAS